MDGDGAPKREAKTKPNLLLYKFQFVEYLDTQIRNRKILLENRKIIITIDEKVMKDFQKNVTKNKDGENGVQLLYFIEHRELLNKYNVA